MTGFKSKKAAALDEDGMYLVHQTAVAFINAEQRTFEWAKPTSWHTPTVVNLPKIPLYTHPQRPWVDLTDAEIDELHGSPMSLEHSSELKWVRIIEAKLKEKNNG